MIKHIVFWVLKPEAKKRTKSENLAEMKAQLENLPPKISEIVSFEVGINYNPSQAAYDIILISEFASEEDLQTYRNHPTHKEVVDFINEITEKVGVVDYRS